MGPHRSSKPTRGAREKLPRAGGVGAGAIVLSAHSGTFKIQAFNTPPANLKPGYTLAVSYTAPGTGVTP